MMRRYGATAILMAATAITFLLVACSKTDTAPSSSGSQVSPSVASPVVSPSAAPPPPAIAPTAKATYPAPIPQPAKKSYPQPSAAELAAFVDAAGSGNIAGTKKYIASGFDINKRVGEHRHHGSRAGFTAVSRAAYGGHFPVLQMLIEFGGHVDGEALGAGALGGNPRVVRYLLDANLKYSRHELSRAAIYGVGNPVILGMLLDAGADPNFRVEKGWTPLTFAAAEGRVDSVRLLLARGANPNDSGSRDTPLIMAALRGHLPTIKLLVAAGANVNAVSNDGRTPYQLAMSARKREAAEFLKSPYGVKPPASPPPAPAAGKPPVPLPPSGASKPPVPPVGVKPPDNADKNLMCQVESRGRDRLMIVTYKLGDKIYAISDEAVRRGNRRGWIDGNQKFSRAEMQDLLKRGSAKCP